MYVLLIVLPSITLLQPLNVMHNRWVREVKKKNERKGLPHLGVGVPAAASFWSGSTKTSRGSWVPLGRRLGEEGAAPQLSINKLTIKKLSFCFVFVFCFCFCFWLCHFLLCFVSYQFLNNWKINVYNVFQLLRSNEKNNQRNFFSILWSCNLLDCNNLH